MIYRDKIKYGLALIILFTFLSACNASSTKHVKSSAHEPRVQDITLAGGRLIEVAYVTPIPSKQEALNRDYFPKAGPLAKEYGGKMLGMFDVVKNAGGDINPEMIFVFEWPDVASKKAFDSDSRFLRIKPIRDEAFSLMRFAFYEVKQDTTITFRENKVYEFFAAWINPDGNEKLNEYFEVSAPIKKSYGRPEPVLKPC